MESVYLTLIFIVFFGAIAVFFAHDFKNLAKQIFEVRGMLLLLPLALASCFVYTFDYWVLWALYYYREILQIFLNAIHSILPFQKGSVPVAIVILLALVSIIPSVLLNFISLKKTYKPYQYPYLTSTLILILSSVCLLVVDVPM